MEANELHSVSISPMVTNSFALEWSEDNHISLVTQQGVHVFELVPHPMCIYPTFRFWRTFIFPSEFLPTEPFQKLINNVLWRLDREDIYRLLMDPAITAKIEDRTDIVPRILRVAWSPAKLNDTWRCLPAILCSTGGVEILYKLGSSWHSMWNVTKLWFNSVKEESGYDAEAMTEREFKKVAWENHLKRLLCTALVWSPLFLGSEEQLPFSYLVGAFRSTDLVFVRVNRVSELSRLKEPSIAYKTKLGSNSRVCEMLWLTLDDGRHLILVGHLDGRIHGLCLTIKNAVFDEAKVFKYHDHADRIIPSSLKLLNTTDGGVRLVLVTKGPWLLVLNIDNSGECVKTRQLRVGDSFITGLVTVSSEKVILSTQNANLYSSTITDDSELSSTPLKTDFKPKKLHYFGLARSRNSSILMNVTSPATIHDHLLNREPTNLQIFTLLDSHWDPWRIIEANQCQPSLYSYWDCLESIRVRAARSLDPLKELPPIPTELNALSIHYLRVVTWLTLVSQVLEKKQMLKGVEKIVGEISEAQPLIFVISGCEHLRRLSEKSSLKSEQKRCVSFLRMYLEIYLAGEEEGEEERTNEITKKVRQALALTSHLDSMEVEACNLCGEILTDLPWTIESCPAGHKLPRCSITLLQITSIKYRVCPVCGRIFHPSLDEEYEETRCLYCDVPAQYDSRVMQDSLEGLENKWKNLSKRPASIIDPKLQDNEAPSAHQPNGKPKKSGINPQTFAVIVNKDDDDSCITETWQEF